MPEYLCKPLANLTTQLLRAPVNRRLEQMERAEDLYWNIDPQRLYPWNELVRGITGFMPDRGGNTSLVGEPVRHDLMLMVMDISESLDQKASDFDPIALDIKGLAQQLNVSSKTIDRYRKQGLFARKLEFPDGRRRIGFPPNTIQHFLEHMKPRSERAARYKRLTETQRVTLVQEARELAAKGYKPQRVARHLAERVDHTVESMRLLIRNHDRDNPEHAIFPDHTPPLTDRQKRAIHRAYHKNIPVAHLARRYGKQRDAIYRAVNLERARNINELSIKYVDHPWFHLPNADNFIFTELPASPRSQFSTQDETDYFSQPPEALPEQFHLLFDLEEMELEKEQSLFIQFNFLKYKAQKDRTALDKYRPKSVDLDTIQTMLRQASAISRELVLQNLRYLMSTARLHTNQKAENPTAQLMGFIKDGLPVMMNCIETHDVTRNARFHTFLNWTLRRHYANVQAVHHNQPTINFDWPVYLNPTVAAITGAQNILKTLGALLDDLEPIEQRLLTLRLGINGAERDEPLTLADVADALGVSVKEARRIEKITLHRLREAADKRGLKLPESLLQT